MKKDDKIKLPQYLPLIVKARLHTGGREYEKIKQELKGQGFTCNQMKSMVREGNYFDGLVLYLSKWNWDNHESWHLYSWDDKDDEKVMLGIYEAEQYHPYNRYKGDFEKFQSDWKNEEYDPGMTFTFKDSEVEVLEVLQEEVDNIDKAGGGGRGRTVPETEKTATAPQAESQQGQQVSQKILLTEEMTMAKISKKTIESLREFLDRGCDYAGTQETVTEIANEALRENGCELCQCDDASVCDWDGDEVCTVEDFANVFWDKAVEKILNVLATEE